jgi:Glycosyl transferases group 1
VGNFTAKKDQATLLRAFAPVVSALPEARLVLVGIGPLETTLRRQASDLALQDAVMFAGSRDDVFELLPALDVFVLSSRYEGLPIALLEAMASGVAPVATRVGGIPEVITDGHDGVLLEPGDPDRLAATLVDLLTDHDRRSRLAAQARDRAKAFDLARAVRQIESVYDRALANGSTGRPENASVAPGPVQTPSSTEPRAGDPTDTAAASTEVGGDEPRDDRHRNPSTTTAALGLDGDGSSDRRQSQRPTIPAADAPEVASSSGRPTETAPETAAPLPAAGVRPEGSEGSGP